MKNIFTKSMGITLMAVLFAMGLQAQELRSVEKSINQQSINVPEKSLEGDLSVVRTLKPETPQSRAGTSVFSEGFETATDVALPAGWTTQTISGNAWVSRAICAHSGARGLGNYYVQNGANRNAWAFSPGFTLTEGTTYTVSFWLELAGWPPSEFDYLTVKIGQTATAAGMASAHQIYFSNNVALPNWTLISETFTPLASGTYYLGFHAGTPNGEGDVIKIDDIYVGIPTSNDLLVSASVFPYTQIPITQTSPVFKAQVTNIGTDPQTDIELSAAINGTTVGTSAPLATLAPGASQTLSVATSGSVFVLGSNELTYTVSQNETDDDPSDNTASGGTFTGTQSTFAVDNNMVHYQYGSTSTNTTFGNVFEFTKPTKLCQLKVYFNTTTGGTGNYNLTIGIYPMTGDLTVSATPYQATQTYVKPNAYAWQTINITNMPTVPAGRYYISFTETTTTRSMNILADDNSEGRTGYQRSGNTLVPMGVAPMIRLEVDLAGDDIAIIANNPFVPYTAIPKLQAAGAFAAEMPFPTTLTVQAYNNGLNTQNTIRFTATFDGTPLGISNTINTLAAGATSANMNITVPGGTAAFSPAPGMNNMVFNVQQSQTDEVPANNTATFTLDIGNKYQLDAVTAISGGVGSNTGTISAGNIFNIYATTTLTEVEMGINGGGKPYTLSLYKVTQSGSTYTINGAALFTTTSATTVSGFTTVKVPPTELTAGGYYLCINQTAGGTTADNISLVYDTRTNARRLYTKAIAAGNGTNLDVQSSFGAGVLRMIVDDRIVISTYVDPVGAGTVTGGGAYDLNDPVELTAIANPGYKFDHWQDGTTTNPLYFNATVNATYTAYFIEVCESVPTNLEVNYSNDCGTATLTWDAPTGSGKGLFKGASGNAKPFETKTPLTLTQKPAAAQRTLPLAGKPVSFDNNILNSKATNTLYPGAFAPGGCAGDPWDFVFYTEDSYDTYATGTNVYDDMKYGYVFKGVGEGTISGVSSILLNDDYFGTGGINNVNIYAEIWSLGANDLPLALLGTSQPLATTSMTINAYDLYTFTFATPIPVPANGNFAAVITVPLVDWDNYDNPFVAVASSRIGCYNSGTANYAFSWSDFEGDGSYDWYTMNDGWGISFDLAIFPVIETEDTPVVYNVYCDGTQIAGPISETTFDDTTFDNTTGHEWSVTTVCVNGIESDPVSVIKEVCEIDPCRNVTLGTDATAYNQMPVNTYFENSYVQHIFTAAEIGGEGIINSVSFQYINSLSLIKNNQTIYLGYTTKNVFASTADWVPLTELTEVFSGNITFNNTNDWFTIEFDTPFEYNHPDCNLVLAVLNASGTWNSVGNTFRFTEGTTGDKTWMAYQDGIAIDPANPSALNMSVVPRRSNTRFNICEGVTPPECNAPTNLTATYDFLCQQAKLTWMHPAGGGCNSYNVYRDAQLIDNVAEASYTDTGFDPTEEHTWEVTTVCDAGETTAATVTLNACDDGRCDKEEIGDANDGTYQIPINHWYHKSYVQQIYLANDIGEAGEITALAFHYMLTTSLTKTPVTIYLGNTTKTEFSSTTDWVPLSQMQQVFTGSITFENGWTGIYFDVPFAYTGCNLVVAVLNNSNVYANNTHIFYVSPTGANRTLQTYKDNGDTPVGDINPNNITTTGSLLTDCNNIIFNICDRMPKIDNPVALQATDITCASFIAHWSKVKDATGYVLNVCTEDAAGTVVCVVEDYMLTDTFYLVTDLEPETIYCYTVTTVNAIGVCEEPAEICATTTPAPIITASVIGAGGTITPSGAVAVKCGEDKAFSFTLNDCYDYELWVNGVLTPPDAANNNIGYYTFHNVTEDGTIEVRYSLKQFNITVEANPAAGGTVTGGGTNIACGTTITVTATENPNYYFTNWTTNGVEVSTNVSFTFTVTQDSALIANFVTCPGDVYDAVNNITYPVIPLEGLCWFQKNLYSKKYQDGSDIPFARLYSHPGVTVDEEIYGLLYSWYSAVNDGTSRGNIQGACPNGWHIPSQAEWNLLAGYPASQLMGDFWIDPPGPGTDDYDFSALPAGWYNNAIDRYQDLYGFTGWWASDGTPDETTAIYCTISYYCDVMQKEMKLKSDGLSVRCVAAPAP